MAEGQVYYVPKLGEEDRKTIHFPEDQQTEKLKNIKRIMETSVKNLPKFDAWLIWLGQHGNASRCIPKRDGTGDTTPLLSDARYTWPVMNAIESQDASPIWLCPDPRNMLKMRDSTAKTVAKDCMAQYDCRKNIYLRDGGSVKQNYVYSAIELLAVPYTEFNPRPWSERTKFGILVNEGNSNTPLPRKTLVKRWILEPMGQDVEIVGHWSDESMAELNIHPTTVPVSEVSNTLQRWKSTLTFPANATGWATSKPWECFAAGIPCFRHPKYDDQNHVYRWLDPETRDFLSPAGYNTLGDCIKVLDEDEGQWKRVIEAQRSAFERAYKETDGGFAKIREELAK
jgi:hypothetical protein